jgi:hypothetical protein
MYVIDLTDEDEIVEFLSFLHRMTTGSGPEHCSVGLSVYDTTIRSLRVGIDPLDHGLKFSVNHSTWSKPYQGAILGNGPVQ